MHTSSDRKTSAIILAGGEGRRVGGADKGLIELDGVPLIEHVIQAISAQVEDIVISANRNIERYRQYGYEVVSDPDENYRGPLAGMSACLPRCQHDNVLVVACDMPCLPSDLVMRLSADDAYEVVIAESGGRMQLVLLVDKTLSASVTSALDSDELGLMRWVKSRNYRCIRFDDETLFTNLNEGIRATDATRL